MDRPALEAIRGRMLRKRLRTTTLYRLYDEDDDLLYVGISHRAMERFSQHSYRRWWRQVASIRIEHFETRGEALEAESKAIRAEKPRHNVAGAPEGLRPLPETPGKSNRCLGCGKNSRGSDLCVLCEVLLIRAEEDKKACS